VIFNATSFTGQIKVVDNTSILQLTLCAIVSGALSCIDTPASPSTGYVLVGSSAFSSSATNCVTGAGVYVPGGSNAKTSTGGDIAATVFQSVLPKFPEGQTLIGAGSTARTNSLLIVRDGHETFQQTTAPTVAKGATAQTGTGGSATLSTASDVSGKIQLVTGTGALAAGTILTVSFNKAFGAVPNVVLTPRNANAAGAIQFYVTAEGTGGFSIAVGAALAASTTYQWAYRVTET
jgi:hypothetical protein